MRLSLALLVCVSAAAEIVLLAPAMAQGNGGWAFCYVDPPTFQTGSYVYTRVFYVGSAPIPRQEIASAMARANPQVASRPISCWHYFSELDAENRRREGMALDKARSYSIMEISWTSPYSPEPQPTQEITEIPAQGTAAPGASDALSAAQATSPALAPNAGKVSSPASPSTVAPSSSGVRFAREKAEYEQKMAEHARQQAEYARALQAHQKNIEEVAARNEEARRLNQLRRAQWEADVAACKAGDHSKCDNTGD